MKLPEWTFLIINPVVKTILRSPLHRILSGNVMIVEFTGRKSGRRFTTPVRYVRLGGNLRCYSNTETQWWKNLRNGAHVALTVAGSKSEYLTEVTENNPAAARPALEHYLTVHPEDAAYHNVRLDKHKRPLPEDLDEAARHAVIVDAAPLNPS